MKLVFMYSDKKREVLLAQAICAAFPGKAELLSSLHDIPADADIVAMVGVKSRQLFHHCRTRGQNVLIFDKGYLRHRKGLSKTWEYWRVSLNAHHPTQYLYSDKCPDDRVFTDLQPWKKKGKEILIAGSSAKYHRFYGIDDPTSYNIELVKKIRQYTEDPIRYRPKPTWKEAERIPSTIYSDNSESLRWAMSTAKVMITHGSNACFEAITQGIPCIVLGDAVAKPVSATTISAVVDPHIPTDEQRYQWLCNLMYWQWTEKEMRSGKMWNFLKGKL